MWYNYCIKESARSYWGMDPVTAYGKCDSMINKLGFGFLRLPKKDGELDWQTVNDLADAFLQGGGTFFDTCYTYLGGMSEAAIRKCVVQRNPRHSFQLCDKLPGYNFKSYDDCQTCFDEELSRCGVEWFDCLMLHWLNDENYAIAEEYDEFRFLRKWRRSSVAKPPLAVPAAGTVCPTARRRYLFPSTSNCITKSPAIPAMTGKSFLPIISAH